LITKKRKAPKTGFWARFEVETRRRFAFSLAQFWPVNEILPDTEAEQDEIYYRRAIARMKPAERVELIREMLRLTQKSVKFFDPEVPTSERLEIICGVLRRFEELVVAAQYAGIDIWQ
jgi:hypothetical protein